MYTKGPWIIDPKAESHIQANSGRSICSISYSDSSKPDATRAENAANARLIAAAPDLLEACHAALSILPDLYDPLRMSEEDHQRAGDLADKLNAAIEKATKQ